MRFQQQKQGDRLRQLTCWEVLVHAPEMMTILTHQVRMVVEVNRLSREELAGQGLGEPRQTWHCR